MAKDYRSAGASATILRQPFSILGAIGLVSLLRSIVDLHSDIDFLIEIYRSMTRPVWTYLFSWIGVSLPGSVQDYLSLGLIVGLARVRSILALENMGDQPLLFVTALIFTVIYSLAFWPISIAVQFALVAGLWRPAGCNAVKCCKA